MNKRIQISKIEVISSFIRTLLHHRLIRLRCKDHHQELCFLDKVPLTYQIFNLLLNLSFLLTINNLDRIC